MKFSASHKDGCSGPPRTAMSAFDSDARMSCTIPSSDYECFHDPNIRHFHKAGDTSIRQTADVEKPSQSISRSSMTRTGTFKRIRVNEKSISCCMTGRMQDKWRWTGLGIIKSSEHDPKPLRCIASFPSIPSIMRVAVYLSIQFWKWTKETKRINGVSLGDLQPTLNCAHVKQFSLSHQNTETLLFTIDPDYGHLNIV